MSGSGSFHVELTKSFENSMVALEKATYGRHDRKGIDKFREHVEIMLENLFGWPQVAGLREESFPAALPQNPVGDHPFEAAVTLLRQRGSGAAGGPERDTRTASRAATEQQEQQSRSS